MECFIIFRPFSSCSFYNKLTTDQHSTLFFLPNLIFLTLHACIQCTEEEKTNTTSFIISLMFYLIIHMWSNTIKWVSSGYCYERWFLSCTHIKNISYDTNITRDNHLDFVQLERNLFNSETLKVNEDSNAKCCFHW